MKIWKKLKFIWIDIVNTTKLKLIILLMKISTYFYLRKTRRSQFIKKYWVGNYIINKGTFTFYLTRKLNNCVYIMKWGRYRYYEKKKQLKKEGSALYFLISMTNAMKWLVKNLLRWFLILSQLFRLAVAFRIKIMETVININHKLDSQSE